MIQGSAQVSTDGQSVDARVRQSTKAGCAKALRGTASSAQIDRAQLRCAIGQLAAGDVMMVNRLDRLARSSRDLLKARASFADRKADLRSLWDKWAETTTAYGRIILTVRGGSAESERKLIRTRIGEGCAQAVARGVKFGRQPKLIPHELREALRRCGASDIART